jgi:hypothetical protein
MKSITEFLPRLLPYLPGCSEPLAIQALLDSAIDFCERSQVLREPLETLYTEIGISQYYLDPPDTKLAIARVFQVVLDSSELVGIMAEAKGVDATTFARPTHYYTSRANEEFTLFLSPLPDDVYELVITVVLRPAKTATQLPDELFDIWSEPILAGAKARIMLVPGQPFSDTGHAAFATSVAARLTNNARIEGNYGRLRGSMRVKMRPLA